jgi:hypothetical protein
MKLVGLCRPGRQTRHGSVAVVFGERQSPFIRRSCSRSSHRSTSAPDDTCCIRTAGRFGTRDRSHRASFLSSDPLLRSRPCLGCARGRRLSAFFVSLFFSVSPSSFPVLSFFSSFVSGFFSCSCCCASAVSGPMRSAPRAAANSPDPRRKLRRSTGRGGIVVSNFDSAISNRFSNRQTATCKCGASRSIAGAGSVVRPNRRICSPPRAP